uniref:Uncharacterized protein n=1 Tax=Desulfobacca acetoxidans TaxID=60893 RepID=A0A7C5ALI0_9BACT
MGGKGKSGCLILAVILGAGVVLAQTLRMVPVPPHLKPRWTPVPESPKVFSAPNVPADIFRGPGGYYLLLGSTWYHSRTLNGPWTLLHQVPEFLTAIGPGSFKASPSQTVKPGSTTGATGASSAPPTTPEGGSASAAAGETQPPLNQVEVSPAPEPVLLYDSGPP